MKTTVNKAKLKTILPNVEGKFTKGLLIEHAWINIVTEENLENKNFDEYYNIKTDIGTETIEQCEYIMTETLHDILNRINKDVKKKPNIVDYSKWRVVINKTSDGYYMYSLLKDNKDVVRNGIKKSGLPNIVGTMPCRPYFLHPVTILNELVTTYYV